VWQLGLGDAERTGALLHALASVKLYNLARDIGEAHDLAAKEPGKLRQLQCIWEKWNATLAKPLWGVGQRGSRQEE
jgi:hypothetical protein